MKLPKNLLQAVIIGIGMAATTAACDKVEITTSNCDDSCKKEEVCVHVIQKQIQYNCPACGMG
jgi:hypothetical protein